MFCRSPKKFMDIIQYMNAVIEFIDGEWIEYEWLGQNMNTLKGLDTEVMSCPFCLSKKVDVGFEYIWYCECCDSQFDQDNYTKLFVRWRYVK